MTAGCFRFATMQPDGPQWWGSLPSGFCWPEHAGWANPLADAMLDLDQQTYGSCRLLRSWTMASAIHSGFSGHSVIAVTVC